MILQMDIKKELSEMLGKGGFKGKVVFDEPMSRHTSLGIGGPADAFIAPEDLQSLSYVVSEASKSGIDVITLGKGTNVLVGDRGIRGAVISLDRFKSMDVCERKVEVQAGAGLAGLLSLCMDNGLAGLEGLYGIPGTVGGAIKGNAGSFGSEIKDALISAIVMDKNGNLECLSADGLGLSYRASSVEDGMTIVSAIFEFQADKPEDVSARMRDYNDRKKAMQPVSERTAGCVFKNPDGLSAGILIDEAGLKGRRVGGAVVSALHANFFVNSGNAKAVDFIGLMETVAEVVRSRFGVKLVPEIRIIGC